MGSKGSQSQTTNQSQTYSADPMIRQTAYNALNMGNAAASQPFQMPQAPVAGFNPFQQQAFNQIQGIQGMTQPYYDDARSMMQAGSTPVNGGDIQSMMNPYAGAALDNMKKYIFDPQRVSTMGNAVQGAGGVGASRLALTSQNLDKTQGDTLSQALAGYYGTAQQGAFQNKGLQQQGAQGMGALGSAAQQAALTGSGALLNAGSQQQQQQQREMNAPYNQQLAQIAYPYQQANFLASLAGGLAPGLGGTTQGTGTTTQSAPSGWAQALGLGTGALGLFGGMGGFEGFGSGKGSGGESGFYSAGTNSATDPWGSGPYNYGNRGGRMMADGGDVGENLPEFPGAGGITAPGVSIPKVHEGFTPIPYTKLQPGPAVGSGAKMDLAPKQQSSGGGKGSGIGDVAKMAMMFLNRGGSVESAGGAVNPYDIGEGYDGGGEVPWALEDRFNDVYSQGDSGLPATAQMEALPGEGDPANPYASGKKIMAEGFNALGQAPLSRSVSGPPANMQPDLPEPAGPAMDVSARRRSPDQGGLGIQSPYNADMNVSQYTMPRDQQPYPDSTKRDWGQKLTRSPWLALATAGAKMAQTRGNIGQVLGAGMEAGIGHLDTQRKELKSEEDVNLKAQHLYQQAKTHLDAYQRMKPYESARLEQEKYAPTYGVTSEGHPILYSTKGGPGIDAVTGQPVKPDEKVTMVGRGAGASGGVTGAIVANLMKADPSLSYREALTIAKRPGIENDRILKTETIALNEAKADPMYATNPGGVLEAIRKKRGLPPLTEGGPRPVPTDKDKQWVIDHPEDKPKFIQRFGVEP